MAVGFRTSGTTTNTTSGTNPSLALTGTIGDVSFVFVNATGNTNLTPTCTDTGSGGTYTLIAAIPKNGGADTLSIFVRNSQYASTASVTITAAIGAHTACAMVVANIFNLGSAGTGVIVQSGTQSNASSGTAPSVTLGSTTALSSIVLAFVGSGSNPPNLNAPAGSMWSTWSRNQNFGTTNTGVDFAFGISNAGTAITWGTNSATNYGSIVLEINVAPQAGVNVSKALDYIAASPPVGVSVAKAIDFLAASPPNAVAVSKLVGYAILNATNTNPPVWPSLTFPDGYVSNPYSYAWDLTPAAAPTTYTLNSGSLPPGLSLHSPSGDIGNVSGTPTTVGVYTFTLLATNAYGAVVSPTYSITIHNATGVPVPLVWVG